MSTNSGVSTRSKTAGRAATSEEETNTWSSGTPTSAITTDTTTTSSGESEHPKEVGSVTAKKDDVIEVASVKSSTKKKLAAKKKILELQLALIQAQEEAECDSEEEGTIVLQRETTLHQHRAVDANKSTRRDPQVTQASDASSSLAEALVSALKTVRDEPSTAAKYFGELPTFDGALTEWIPFKTVYEDTAKYFTSVHNVARLRRALKGPAREEMKGLLYSTANAEDIMQELEARFGNPGALILNEIRAIKKMPKMQEDGKNITAFASRVTSCVAAVKALNKPQYLYSPELADKIAAKLNTYMKYEWYKYSAQYPGEPELQRMGRFLKEMSEQYKPMATLETHSGDRRVSRHEGKRQQVNVTHSAKDESEDSSENETDCESEKEELSAAVAVVSHSKEKSSKPRSEEKKIDCDVCKKNHYLRDCDEFKNLKVTDRWERTKEAGVCFRCLAYKHRRYTCKAKLCGEKGCKGKHHKLLHLEKDSNSECEESKAQVTSVNAVSAECSTYLKIVPIELYGPRGKTSTYALLDEGSTMTLIEENTALAVAPPGKQEVLRIEGVGGKQIKYDSSFKLKLQVKGMFERNMETMHAQTINKLNLMTQAIDKKTVSKYPHLKEVEDVLVYERVRPRVLIGQDNWHLIVSREIKQGRQNEPVASYTSLGWVLHGQASTTSKCAAIINHLRPVQEEATEALLREHFSIESLGIEPKRSACDPEQRAIDLLQKTCERLPTGRMQVGLIWKREDETMPESRAQAERRLLSLERKLNKDENMKKEYTEQVENLLRQDYAEKVDTKADSSRTWYLPHFAVRHPQKKKIRMVFDAAAKSGGKSLNDALLPGPDLLQSLFGVLLRFREGKIAVMADIKEMFLQIKIQPVDRDSQRFLWRDEKGEIQEYRMSSLIFGATSSPCSAIFAKNRNAQDFKEKYPESVKAVEKHFYMDDYLQAFHTAEDALRTVREIKEIHAAAQFDLRGWCSNTTLNESQMPMQLAVPVGDHMERTLGINWNPKQDTFTFTINLRNTPAEVLHGHRPPTKREVMSAVMSLYDPLGFAAPITIQGKKLIQRLWQSGTPWDSEIPTETHDIWNQWLTDIKLLEKLHIPRNVVSNEKFAVELHCFTDASESAYAAAVYVKIEQDTHLLAAKARVAPLKPTSIPRLELQAAVMGTRLTDNIKKEINSCVTRTVYWTDSRTVLQWIRSEARSFKPFVAHRLAEIQELSKTNEWRWVPTRHNVADDATRETPCSFNSSHRWLNGPEFLLLPSNEWPQEESSTNVDSGSEERKKAYTAHKTKIHEPIPDPTRFSSYLRLLRATARVLQSVDRFKKRSNSTAPLARHLHAAENIILQKSQRESFAEDIKNIRNGVKPPRSSKLRKVCTEFDENNLLRATGRIDKFQGDVAEDTKKPIILDAKNYIVTLIIAHYHQTCHHANHETVINELRQRYFIFGLRNAVRSVAHECQLCKLRRAKPTVPDEGELPRERLSHNTHPFNCSAIDYFGPLTITIGRRTEKRWGVMITCLTTRAVHIELAASLTPSSAILALRRFFARRGTPTVLYSDNGTNFAKANKELQEAIENYAMSKKIVWKFIPPGAPHMGGAWERMIRTVKHALTATLHEKAPREETLHTLLLEIEHIINSRPLTPVNPDLSREALTPNHFLIGRSCGVAPLGDFNTSEADSKGWLHSQQLANEFWKRWTKEYLPLLVPRRPTVTPNHLEPKVGDIVLIVDGQLPRNMWPRGEVTQVFRGSDGKVRITEVRTRTGTLRRPTSRLIVLT